MRCNAPKRFGTLKPLSKAQKSAEKAQSPQRSLGESNPSPSETPACMQIVFQERRNRFANKAQ